MSAIMATCHRAPKNNHAGFRADLPRVDEALVGINPTKQSHSCQNGSFGGRIGLETRRNKAIEPGISTKQTHRDGSGAGATRSIGISYLSRMILPNRKSGSGMTPDWRLDIAATILREYWRDV
jgi:hypothetical protein